MSQSIEPTAKFFYANNLKLHYLDWGNAGAPILILQHGMQDHARSWDWVARALCDKWHVIAPDLRGHGDSDWSPDGAYHNPYYLQDFAQLIETLLIQTPAAETVSIVAHSLGGNPAARYAGLYPQRVQQLVLVDAMGPTNPVLERWEKQGVIHRTREWLERREALTARTPRRFDSIDEAVDRMRKANKHLSAEQARHLTEHGLRQQDNQYTWKYDPRAGNFTPEDFAIHLSVFWREITARTLICWGPESWTSNPAEDGNAAFFQNAQTRVFEGAGHWIHHDRLEAFVDVIGQFLSEA